MPQPGRKMPPRPKYHYAKQPPYQPGPPTARSPAPGTANPDGVAELRFKVSIPAGSLGSFREVSGIGVEVETMDYAEGGNNEFVHRLPVRLKFQNVVLKRGITHQRVLLDWFNATRSQGIEAKWGEVTVTLMGPRGESVQTWSFKEAYPVKWTGPTLNATSNQIAKETLEIAHAGMTVV
jgi:phage tail-like protein